MDEAAQRQRGIALMVLGMALVTAVDTTAKHLGAGLNPLQVVWGYYLGIVVPFLVWPLVRGVPLRQAFASRRPGLQMVRAMLLVFSLGCLFTALRYLPLAEATSISFAAPLFVTALSAPLLGERVGPHRWAAVVCGLAGVLVIIRPGVAVMHWAAVLPLISAVSFALYQILTRVLSRTDDLLPTLLFTGIGGALLTTPGALLVWSPPSGVQWLTMILMGFGGAGAHLCIVRAFTLSPASLLAPFNYTRLLWAIVAGFLVFGDLPDAFTLLGGALIAGSGIYVALRERRLGRVLPAAVPEGPRLRP